MQSFLSYLKLMLLILPDIIALVRAIETHGGNVPKAGAAKLDLLKALLADLWGALDAAAREQVSFDALNAMAVKITTRFVAFFNVIGEFRKT